MSPGLGSELSVSKIAFLILLAVVLAGCGTIDEEATSGNESITTDAPTTDSGSERDITKDANEEDRSDRTESEEIEEPQVNPANPYGKEELQLYVNDSLEDRDLMPLINESVYFWESNSYEYAGYNISYNYTNNEANADKIIVFEDVTVCGLTVSLNHSYLGCADIVEDNAPPTVEARIQYNLPDPIVRWTLKHELGHTLGLNHDDEPIEIMGSHIQPLNKTNPVNIHVRDTVIPREATFNREVDDALEYFADHDDLNESESLNYSMVESPEEAHIIITFARDGEECGFQDGGSCLLDGDYDGQYDIRLEKLDANVVAYHIGYALSPFFFEEDPESLKTTNRNERENWP